MVMKNETPMTAAETATYNGWSSYETWNVALWLQNSLPLHSLCLDFGDFADVIEALAELDVTETPDGVSYTDPLVNVAEINEHVFDCDEDGEPLNDEDDEDEGGWDLFGWDGPDED